MESSITGAEALVEKLRAKVTAEKLRPLVQEAARLLRDEARRLAPRETGELENAIVVMEVSIEGATIALGVGIPTDDPAFERGMATEYGTRAIIVGTPEAPVVSWRAKSKEGASMPWLRTAMLNVAPQVEAIFRRAIPAQD